MLRGAWQTQSQSADGASEASQLQEIPPETITVAIFCALPHEVVAVKCSLDEEFPCRPKKVDPKNYMYSFGRIGSLRIVIARFHSVGTVSAAHGATAVSHQFPNVMFALLVGTGTGIPDPPKYDVRLGDIVVSVPQDNHPGVVQYDFGKYEDDGFVLKGSLNKPPPILLSADGQLVEEEIMDRSPLESILQHITNKLGISRPEIEDILFDQNFAHMSQEKDCRKCEEMGGEKVAREARYYPVVHRGLVLSGSGIVRNSIDRERLRRGYKAALCFEMEAAGIMDEIPCLVIRGISDYADAHVQEGWHHYAAAVAAAYCKTILCKVDSQKHMILINLHTVDNLDEAFIDTSKFPIAETAHFGPYAVQHRVEFLDEWSNFELSSPTLYKKR